MLRAWIGTLSIAVLFGVSTFGQPIPPGGLSSEKPVFMGGKQVATTGAKGDLLLALDSSKSFVVLHQDCSRYEIVQVPSTEEKECERDSSRNQNGCRRCEVAGYIAFGKWQPVTPSATLSSTGADGDRRFRVGAYGFGSGKFTSITNADDATGVIQGRANATNPPYNPGGRIDVDKKGSGGGWGGGVNLQWGWRLGGRFGVAVENERNSPSQVVDITRDAGGLNFQQQGSSLLRSVAFHVGPTYQIPGGIVISGGPSWTKWSVDLTQTGSLRAFCPNPCQVVRTDNVSEEAEGTDVGYQLGIEYYPRDSWLGAYVLFAQTTYHDVYDPTRALAWPTDWRDRNLFEGAVIRTTNIRANRGTR